MRSLPLQFSEMLSESLPQSLAVDLAEVLSSTAPASPAIRLNPAKNVLPGPDCGTPVPWSDGLGYWLAGPRPVFAFDPAWQAGLYYVQDASSMALGAALRHILDSGQLHPGPCLALDACAAPGGKSLSLADTLPQGSFVLSNEFDPRRVNILAENIQRRGCGHMAVSRGDTERLRALGSMFDIAVVDAPCSGEGMMRKELEAIAQWSPGLVRSCAQLQAQILDNVWETLPPGAFIVYSTCTFNIHENENQVERLIREKSAAIVPVPAFETRQDIISIRPGCYRFLPGRVDGEGLFIAVLRKEGIHSPFTPGKQKFRAGVVPDDVRSFCRRTLDGDLGIMAPPAPDQTFYAVPAPWASVAEALARTLDLRLAGTPLCTVRGHDLLPAHGLSLAAALRNDAYPRVCLPDYAMAASFLRGESLPGLDAPRGICAVSAPSLPGHPLGWVKNLGNRANNLLPSPWRLHTTPPAHFSLPGIALSKL